MHSLHAILLEILRKKLEFMRVNDANQWYESIIRSIRGIVSKQLSSLNRRNGLEGNYQDGSCARLSNRIFRLVGRNNKVIKD